MVNVYLFGQLGELFGREWKLNVRSPDEAIRAIAAQIDGFVEYLNSNQEYVLDVDGQGSITEPCAQAIDWISIAPYIAGSGAEGRILTGAALLGASLIFPGAILGFSSATIGLFGASMIFGGVLELLSEQNESNGESFLFDASGVSRAVQGAPVPVLFGTRLISPIPISVLVDNENISINFVP